MLYYQFKVNFVAKDGFVTSKSGSWRGSDHEDREAIRDRNFKLNCATIDLNEKQDYNVRFFIAEIKDTCMTLFGVIGYKNNKKPIGLATQFVKDLGFEISSIEGSEIKLKEFVNLAKMSDRNGFIDDDYEVLNLSHLGSYRNWSQSHYSETISPAFKSEKEILKKSKELFCGDSLKDEIDRIISVRSSKFVGHPVHYILTVDDDELKDNIVELLTGALHKANRLKSRRVVSVYPTEMRDGLFDETIVNTVDVKLLNDMYENIPGGAIVISPGSIEYETETISSEAANVDDIAKLIRDHHRDCLAILVFKRSEEKSKNKLKSALSDLKFVEIKEDAFYQDKAIEVLKNKAKADKINDIKSLLEKVPADKEQVFYISDVNKIYNTWVDERLSTEVFTQYKEIKHPEKPVQKNIGNAYETLQNLIGLSSAKSIINEALDFNKVQKMYTDKGLNDLKPARHMVFTGNPGTAKTTVARLFAQIMKDNKVLPNGKLVEVGRKDLVGKYVGWTAKLVEEAFQNARGSVLFIDEAYSLCDERDGLFGDEAINTIVQMMENQRDDTIVIFAGYPDKMQKFLDKNPGLRSRIAFHVNFDDYNEDELVDILKLIAKDNKVNLADDVEAKIRDILSRAIKEKDFGNGRFVRNLFERARMRQASRIVSMDQNCVDENALTTLVADDFAMPDELANKKDSNKAIGFVA